MSARESSGQAPLVVSLLLLAAVAAAGYYTWRHLDNTDTSGPEPVATSAAPAPAAENPPPTAPVAAPAEVQIQHPVDAVAEADAVPAKGIPALDESDAYVTDVLIGLIGKTQVLQLLQTGQFVRHVVATVDNLARQHAPPQVWPVTPAPQRFTTVASADGQGEVISPANSARYAAFVTMVESVDTAKVTALYRRHYGYFQQAYEELGFPGQYFNDRLVQVIDLLLATPVPQQMPAVTLVQVKGPIASQRPWVRYEFVDPALAALSSGQKMLVRMGPEHQRRLQARLRDIRSQITVAR